MSKHGAMTAGSLLPGDPPRFRRTDLLRFSGLMGVVSIGMLGYMSAYMFGSVGKSEMPPLSTLISALLPGVVTSVISLCSAAGARLATQSEQLQIWALADSDPHIEAFLDKRYPDRGPIEQRDAKLVREYSLAKMREGLAANVAQAKGSSKQPVTFDYHGCDQNEIFYSRREGDDLLVSVGRSDWMPITVFMLLAEHMTGEDAMFCVLQKAAAGNDVTDFVGLPEWCRASLKVMKPLLKQIESHDARREAVEREDGPHAGFTGFNSALAFEVFSHEWFHYNVTAAEKGEVSFDTDGRRMEFMNQPELVAYRDALEDLKIALNKWATTWLLDSNVQLSVQQQMIHVPGYQPLLERIEQRGV